MPLKTRTSASKLPARARRHAERLVELYEREAYRTYNVALRITCDDDAAAEATETAFLRHLAASASTAKEAGEKATLLNEAIVAAVSLAPRTPAEAQRGNGRRSAGDRLLAAASALPPPERAAIALISVGERGPEAIAAATGTSKKSAAGLVSRARKGFGAGIKVPANRLGPKLRDWPWVEPPQEIWDALYPRAHRLLVELEDRDLTESEPKSSRPSRPPRRKRRRAHASRRARGPSRSSLAAKLMEGGRGGVWAFRAAVLAIILLPAAVVGLAGAGGDPTDDAALSASADGLPITVGADSSSGGSTYDALSPKELDQLRLQELRALQRYSRAQTDKSLSLEERSRAAQKAEALLALARERLAEAERRERAVAERERQAEARERRQANEPSDDGAADRPRKGRKGKGKKKRDRAGSVSDCLQTEDGTYICPQ